MALKIFQENNDLVLSHIWRVNDMRKKLRKIVLDGCITGLMVARTYWDKYAYDGIGEVKIGAVHPKYVFFDNKVEELNIADGSCDCFIYAVWKPLSWFNYYWPGKTITPSEDSKDKPSQLQGADYIEAYMADYDCERTTEIAEGKYTTKEKRKYPFGRRVIVGGDTKLEDEAIDYFPDVPAREDRGVGSRRAAIGSGLGVAGLKRDARQDGGIALVVPQTGQLLSRADSSLPHAGRAIVRAVS